MKFTVILVALLMAACGRMETISNASKVGELKSYSTTTPLTVDVNNVRSICTAFNTKSSTITTGVTLNFGVVDKGCAETPVNTSSANVEIQSTGSGFRFVNTATSSAFIFPEVETSTSGLLAEFCQSLNSTSTFKNPIINGANSTYISTSGVNPADCPTVSGEVCVLVEKGVLEGTMYRIHTKEVMRVRTATNAGRIGYFTYRKKVAQAQCSVNESIRLEATLL